MRSTIALITLTFAAVSYPAPHLRITTQTCPDSTIFYVNGVNTDRKGAFDQLIVLAAKLEDRINETASPIQTECLRFDLAYNANEPLFFDFFQAAGQIIGTEISKFWRIFGNLDQPPDAYQSLAQAQASSIDSSSYILDPDLERHVQQYSTELTSGRKVVTVAHSQGNFYANEAYALLFGDFNLPNPNFKVISVATPSNFVAGGGPYTTLLEDFIWGLPIIPSPLTWNTTNTPDAPCTNAFSCHYFIDSYLAGETSRRRILDQIIAAISPPAALIPTLIFDGSGDPRFFNAKFSDPVIDSHNRLIVISTHFSLGCGFNICGIRLNAISKDGTLNWQVPNDGGFISPRGGPLLIGPNDRIYVGGFGPNLFAFDSAGNLIPGWPVGIAPPDAGNVAFFQGDPVTVDHDGVAYAGAGVFFSFSGFPGTIMAINPDATLKWRRDFSGGGTNSQFVQGPQRDIYLRLGFSHFMRLAGDSGATLCEQPAPTFLEGLVAGSDKIFATPPQSDVISFDTSCNFQTIFTSPGARIGLQKYADDKLFGTDFSLFALSKDGSLLWRNHEILPATIHVVRNGLLYLTGQHLSDGNKTKLFLLSTASGQIVDSVETAGLCDSCGVAVTSDGTIYLNDRNSTKIYKLN